MPKTYINLGVVRTLEMAFMAPFEVWEVIEYATLSTSFSPTYFPYCCEFISVDLFWLVL